MAKDRRPEVWRLVLSATLALLAACGGGGGGGGGGAAPATVEIDGSVYAAPVAGALVTARAADGTTVAGPVTSGADGSFRLELPAAAASGDLVLEASGGRYADETTGMDTESGRLRAWVPAGTLQAGSAAHLSAATTLLANLVLDHGRNALQARQAFAAAFGFTPALELAPRNDPADSATHSERLAALRAGALSRLTLDLGLPPEGQFELLAALAADLADGTLDGSNAGRPVALAGGTVLPEDVQNRYEHALLGFLGSAGDRTGLGPDEIGLLPFAPVALSDNYRVEYRPLDPGAALGQTPFQLAVTRRADGMPVAGLQVTLRPTMHMADQEHSTPVGAVSDRGDGTYETAVYYSMAGGDPWGYWSLAVILEDGSTAESVVFHPTVGTPSYARLQGQEDRTAGPGGLPLQRPYYLFDAGLFAEDPLQGTYRFEVFVAALDGADSYPALFPGQTLHTPDGLPWTVDTVEVKVSIDAETWHPAMNLGNGLWSAAGIAGIDPFGTELTLFVALEVDGETKTTNGRPVDPALANAAAQLSSGGAACCF